MGFKETWLLLPAADELRLLPRMRLRPAREGETAGIARLLRLPSGWTLLAFNHYAEATEPFRDGHGLAAWSRDSELLGLEINETVNVSHAWGMREGRQVWSLMHILDSGQEHLEVEGEPPEGWRALHEAELARLQAGELGDFVFSVPIDTLALRIGTTPYEIDAENDGELLVRDWPPVDVAMRQALSPDAPPPPKLQNRFDLAARGDATAQVQIGIALLRLQPATAATGALAQAWLLLAAEQGQGAAQALLGQAIVNGRPGFERDVRQGLQWLELSAAQDHPEGLRRLAEHLYETSIHRRDGYGVPADDPASRQRLRRMLALQERGVLRASEACLANWAERVHNGMGAPADAVAGKAVMRIARVRAADFMADVTPDYLASFEPSPEQAEEVASLAQAWSRDPRLMVQAVRARRAQREAEEQALKVRADTARQQAALAQAELAKAQADLAVARASARQAGAAAALTALVDDGRGRSVGRMVWAPGCTALLIGIALLLLALVLAPGGSRGLTRSLMLAAGLSGAWGAWQLGGAREWAVTARGLLAVLMLVPGLGLVLSVGLILKQVRGD